MVSLSQRLKAIHVPDERLKLPKDEFRHISLDELWGTKLGFGSTHTSKTYGCIWVNHQSYVTRFLERHSGSTRPLHRKFVYFCEVMIERAELEGARVPMTDNGNAPAPVFPTVQAKGQGVNDQGQNDHDDDDHDDDAYWDVLFVNSRFANLEACVDKIEKTLAAVSGEIRLRASEGSLAGDIVS
eukprot:s863_g52.t1